MQYLLLLSSTPRDRGRKEEGEELCIYRRETVIVPRMKTPPSNSRFKKKSGKKQMCLAYQNPGLLASPASAAKPRPGRPRPPEPRLYPELRD